MEWKLFVILILAIISPLIFSAFLLISTFKDKKDLLNRFMARDFPEYRQFGQDLAPILKEQRRSAKENEKKKAKRITEEDEFQQKVADEF